MDGERWKRAWVVTLAGVVALGFAMSGCGAKEPGRFYHKGVSIKLPDDWEKQKDVMGAAIAAVSPLESADDAFRENVNVIAAGLPAAWSAAEFASQNIAHMQKLLTDFEEQDRGQASIDGKEARWFVYNHRMGTVKIRALAYFVAHGRRGAVITCSAAPETFDSHRTQFEEIAGTFRFE